MTSDDHNPSRAPPMPQHPRAPASPPPAKKDVAKDARQDVRKDAPKNETADDLDLAIDEIAPTTRLKEGFTGQER